jgi:hypothetical protein
LWTFVVMAAALFGTMLPLFAVANLAGIGTPDVETGLAVIAVAVSFFFFVLPDMKRADRWLAAARRRFGHEDAAVVRAGDA